MSKSTTSKPIEEMAAEITLQGERLSDAIKEEEEKLFQLCERLPARGVVIVVPKDNQWIYDYQTVRKQGRASARVVKLLAPSPSTYLDRAVLCRYGPNREFTPHYLTYHDLREKFGGLAKILVAMNEELARQLKAIEASREAVAALVAIIMEQTDGEKAGSKPGDTSR